MHACRSTLEDPTGREAYLRQIAAARERYDKVRQAGHDRSLVFPNWTRASTDDRTLVYQKGALVLHELREHLGDGPFWSGIRSYTRTSFGKSVGTTDFQTAMERAAGKSLAEFFAQWVYGPNARS